MKAHGYWNELKIVDGQWCFEMVDTHGIPMDLMVQECRSRGWIPDWNGFIRAAVQAGWSDKTILKKFREIM